jgi:hypothetical protein
LSIEVNSYHEKWQKDDQDLVFYRRKYIEPLIIILLVCFIAFFIFSHIIEIPFHLGLILLLMIVFLLLQWAEKYIILGKTFISIRNSQFTVTDLILFTLFFIVYVFLRRKDNNKMTCILFKNIIDISEKNSNTIIIKHKINNTIEDYIIDLNMMLDTDKQLYLEKMQSIRKFCEHNL